MNITEDIIIHNKNCFEVFPTLEDKSINLFILDLPYGQTACKWDTVIDLEQMWKDVKRIMKPNALIVFFCTAKFGYTLIHSNPKWFKYDLIWKKSRKVGFLSANKMPLRQHENIYVFKDKQGTYHPQKTEGQPYKCKEGKKNKDDLYNIKNDKRTITENKGDRHPTSIIDHENIYVFKDKQGTYHPQKTEGKPYTDNRRGTGYYGDLGDKYTKDHKIINKGDRHPTSIIDHENIYVFDNPVNEEYNDLELSRNKDLREYAEKVKKFIGKNRTQIEKKIGNKGMHHFYSFKGVQFGLPTKENYEKLIKEYNIDEMEGYLEYDILKGLWEDSPPKIESTYNSQKTEGKAYKSKEHIENAKIYNNGKPMIRTETQDTKHRHPTSIINEIPEYEGDSILVYKNPHKTIHRTQKPVELLEWLIKTYSNEGDTVMDFTMGSGTCGIACMNQKRKFIGVEMDKEIFELAKNRFEEHKKKSVIVI